MQCPCNSNLDYHECCQPLHTHTKVATTAEALMRSRYCAFVLQKIDYIVATTASFQQTSLDKQAISDWSKNTQWVGLEVLQHSPKKGKNHAQVEFKAYFLADEGQAFHHEISIFVKIKPDDTWYFLDPTVPMAITQKQPCPCGSGEKYKRCCGQFLS